MDADRPAEPGTAPGSEAARPRHTRRSRLLARLRNYFLTGLIVAAPVSLTVWIIWTLVNWVDSWIKPLIPRRYDLTAYLPFDVPGFGLVVAVVLLTGLGLLTRNLVGRKTVELGDRLLERMPIVRPIYRGLKQIFETLFAQSGTSFRKAVLVEFPGPGMWSLAFLSTAPDAEIVSKLPGKAAQISVFMPCTPNPTTGFFFYIERDKVIELDMSVDAAAKLIMSAGLIQADSTDPARRLSMLADTARRARRPRKPRRAPTLAGPEEADGHVPAEKV